MVLAGLHSPRGRASHSLGAGPLGVVIAMLRVSTRLSVHDSLFVGGPPPGAKLLLLVPIGCRGTASGVDGEPYR